MSLRLCNPQETLSFFPASSAEPQRPGMHVELLATSPKGAVHDWREF